VGRNGGARRRKFKYVVMRESGALRLDGPLSVRVGHACEPEKKRNGGISILLCQTTGGLAPLTVEVLVCHSRLGGTESRLDFFLISGPRATPTLSVISNSLVRRLHRRAARNSFCPSGKLKRRWTGSS